MTVREYLGLRARIESWRKKDEEAPVLVKLSTGGTLELRNDVPKSRSECPQQRPCGHVKCRYHMWRVDDCDRPGRPYDGKRAGTTLRPAWLQKPLPPSCELDLTAAGGMTPTQIAKAMGTVRSNVWVIQKRPAVAKAFAELREILGIGDDK